MIKKKGECIIDGYGIMEIYFAERSLENSIIEIQKYSDENPAGIPINNLSLEFSKLMEILTTQTKYF